MFVLFNRCPGTGRSTFVDGQTGGVVCTVCGRLFRPVRGTVRQVTYPDSVYGAGQGTTGKVEAHKGRVSGDWIRQ